MRYFCLWGSAKEQRLYQPQHKQMHRIEQVKGPLDPFAVGQFFAVITEHGDQANQTEELHGDLHRSKLHRDTKPQEHNKAKGPPELFPWKSLGQGQHGDKGDAMARIVGPQPFRDAIKGRDGQAIGISSSVSLHA